MTRIRIGPPILLILLLPAAPLLGDAAPAPARVHLCDARTIFLAPERETIWPGLPSGERYAVAVFQVPEDRVEWLMEPDAVVKISETWGEPVERGTMLRTELPRELLGGRDFVAVVKAVGGGSERQVAVAEFSTRPKALVRVSTAREEASYRMELLSRTPLKPIPREVTVVEIVRPAGLQAASGDRPQRVEETLREHQACLAPACCPGEGIVESEALPGNPRCAYPRVSFQDRGGLVVSDGANLCLEPGDRLRRGSTELRVSGLRDIFGQPVKAKGKIPARPVPKGKDDAHYFIRALFESAEGADDSFALDLKLQPSFRMQGAWLFRPELTASIARNVPKASDSIRLAPLFSRTFIRRTEGLTGHTISVGPALEGDRDLDRINALLELRWQPELKEFYQSQEARRQRLALRQGLAADAVHWPVWGWGITGWLGLEAGGSIDEQTVESSKTDATLEIPSYEIARLRSQIQAFVEYRRLSLTVASGLRYLASEELAAREAEDGSLTLREIDEARPYTEAGLSLALDRTRNVALALTYKDGSEPPLFSRVEKFSLGVVAKY